MRVNATGRSRTLVAVATFVITTLIATTGKSGLVVSLTFDSSFSSSFGGNTAAAEAAANYAAQQYDNLFTNPVTLNITVKGVADSSIFGQSQASQFTNNAFTTYTAIRNALISTVTTGPNVAAVQALPVVDPTGAPNTWLTFQAEGKALGLVSGTPNSSDGTVTFGAGFAWNFDTANRAVSGEYDFTGVVEHEIAEIMGRAGFNGRFGGEHVPIDLWRYNAGAFSSDNTGPNNYFSTDGGVTNQGTYNDHNANNLDTVDWVNGHPADSYNQFSSSGVVNDISTADINEMNVIGWTVGSANATPEPGTLTLFALGLTGFSGLGWLKRRRAQAS